MVKVQGNTDNGLMELLTKRGAHLENISTSSKLGRFFGYGTKATPVSQIGIDTLIKNAGDTKNLQTLSSSLNRGRTLFWNGTSTVASWATWGTVHGVQTAAFLAFLNTGVISSTCSAVDHLYNCYGLAEGAATDSDLYADPSVYEQALDGLACATGYFKDIDVSSIVSKIGTDFIHPYNTSLELLGLTEVSLGDKVYNLFLGGIGTSAGLVVGIQADRLATGGTVRKVATTIGTAIGVYYIVPLIGSGIKKAYSASNVIPSSCSNTVEGLLRVDNSNQQRGAVRELVAMVDSVKSNIQSKAKTAKSNEALKEVKTQGKHVALALADVTKLVKSWGLGEKTIEAVQGVIDYLDGIEDDSLQRMQYSS